MEVSLVKLNDNDDITYEQYYQKNLDKIKAEGNFITEGILEAQYDNNKDTYQLKAFIAKDGLVVVEDWELLEDIIMSPIAADEVYFIANENKYNVFIDDENDSFKVKCDYPGAIVSKILLDRIKQARQYEQETPSKVVKEESKYKL